MCTLCCYIEQSNRAKHSCSTSMIRLFSFDDLIGAINREKRRRKKNGSLATVWLIVQYSSAVSLLKLICRWCVQWNVYNVQCSFDVTRTVMLYLNVVFHSPFVISFLFSSMPFVSFETEQFAYNISHMKNGMELSFQISQMQMYKSIYRTNSAWTKIHGEWNYYENKKIKKQNNNS